MYSIRAITTDEEFLAAKGAWNDVVTRAADPNTFLTHSWQYAWWTSYRPDARMHIIVAEREGRICGIAPLMLMRERGLGWMFRRLRFIGDGTFETDHMNFIVDVADRAHILAALLCAIDELPWDVAHFNQMPEASANTAQLLEHARQRNWSVSATEIPCPRRVLPRSYDELLRSLPSRLRTSVRSSRRDLEGKHRVEFGMCTTHEELPQALDALYRNHGGRWQAKGEEGAFVNQRRRNFYARLSASLLDAGSLRFFYLKLDGRAVALQFCFEHSGTVLLLQEGFDYDFAKQNVGNVLRAMVFERLIADGVTVYDFLAGTTRHKQSWSDSAPNDLNIRACRPSFVGRVAFHLPRWADRLRSLLLSRKDAQF